MAVWFKFAALEWWRSAKSGRDFLWLSLLLLLTLSLALLVWGSREGLLNRFMDVSLGYIPQVGIPILVDAVKEDSVGLDRNLLEHVKSMGINIHPYNLIEGSYVSFPGATYGSTPIWKDEYRKQEQTMQEDADSLKYLPIKGWAVSENNPLWKGSQTVELPLEVMLSRPLFQQYFQCTDYDNFLEQKLPHFTPSVSSNPLACLANNILWLEVKLKHGRELLPFKIHWIEGRISTVVDKLAFLFPQSTLWALQEASFATYLKYFPEAEGASVNRIKQLVLHQNADNQTLHDNVATCLLDKKRKNTPSLQINPEHILSLDWIQQCAARYQVSLQEHSTTFLQMVTSIKGHRFRYDNDYLTVLCEIEGVPCQPCQSVVVDWKKEAACGAHEATVDLLKINSGGYFQAIIYAGRDDLFQLVTKIESDIRRPSGALALSIEPGYKNALLRFDFIYNIMGLLNSTYSVFFVIFLFVLLGIQIGIVIQNRKHDYGIFLAKGLPISQIYLMLFMQIFISFGVALGSVLPIIAAVRHWLSNEFSALIIEKQYDVSIQVGDLELLPSLMWPQYYMISGVIFVVALGIAMFYMMFYIRSRQEAAHLFS